MQHLSLLRFNRSVTTGLPFILLACLAGVGQRALAQPADLSPGDTYHLVYVTDFASQLSSSTQVPPANTATWGGLAAADWIATYWAQRTTAASFHMSVNEFVTGDPDVSFDIAGTASYWTAILSDASASAADRLDLAGPLYNMQLERVATNETDLFDGSLAAPIRYTEIGNAVAGNLQVWTGTGTGGSWTGVSAGNWDNPALAATIGMANSSTSGWIASGTQTGGTARLYAVSPAFTVPLLGDFNDDGTVDLGDYTVWRDHLGASDDRALHWHGSATGGVDADDYLVWQQNFGQSLPGGRATLAGAAAIPEPATLLLSLLATTALVVRRPLRR